jgi:hypothetical protein
MINNATSILPRRCSKMTQGRVFAWFGLVAIVSAAALAACGGGGGGSATAGSSGAGSTGTAGSTGAAGSTASPTSTLDTTPVDLASNVKKPRGMAQDASGVYWIEAFPGAGVTSESIKRYNPATKTSDGTGGGLSGMSAPVLAPDDVIVSAGSSPTKGTMASIVAFPKAVNMPAKDIANGMGIAVGTTPGFDGTSVFYLRGDGQGGLDIWTSPLAAPSPVKLRGADTPNVTAILTDADAIYFVQGASVVKAPKTAGGNTTTVVPPGPAQESVDWMGLDGDKLYVKRLNNLEGAPKAGGGTATLVHMGIDSGASAGTCGSLSNDLAVYGGYLYWISTCAINTQAEYEIWRVSTTPGGTAAKVAAETDQMTTLAVGPLGVSWATDAVNGAGAPSGKVRLLKWK